MPIAEGLVEGDGLEGGEAANNVAEPALAGAGVGVGTGLWAADSQRQRKSKSNFHYIILRDAIQTAES